MMKNSVRRQLRRVRDPLQVNLRRVVYLILYVVVLPTLVLTGLGIAAITTREQPLDLVLGLLEFSFAVSVVAGGILLMIVAGRGVRLARVQDTFLSQMGHEILTPLAGIRLHTQILEGMQVPDQARDSLVAIRREANRLQELVQKTLRWREVRSSKHLYRKNMTTAGEVVERALEIVPEQDEINVRVLTPDACIKGDADALAEAIVNLLRNAKKYSPAQAPVELTVRRLGGTLIFVVSDRGPGIPPEEMANIFNPFHRLIPEDRPDPGGSGLGLSIARQIVKAHRGTISIIHRRGGGARFVVHLPSEQSR